MKLVYGVGINDADYTLSKYEKFVSAEGLLKVRQVWVCPFYSRWQSMITRCYSKNFLIENPSYKDCTVCEEWLTFSKFKSWMETQNWSGKTLDKDILCKGNKIYSPEFCVFVHAKVNLFIIERESKRGEWPIGVHFEESYQKYKSTITSNNKTVNLGRYDTAEQAHQAWLDFKLDGLIY